MDDVIRELNRELVKKQKDYAYMTKWLKEEVAKVKDDEAHAGVLIRIASELDKQIALAKDIEVTKEHIDMVEIYMR